MRERILSVTKAHRQAVIQLLRHLIRQPSPSCHEEKVAKVCQQAMRRLAYDETHIDRFGNVIGRIGSGSTQVVLAANMDTTALGQRSSWRFNPLEGEFKGQKVFGHGAICSKGALSCMIYAGAVIKELNLAPDASVYVIGTVQGDACEGMAYKALFDIEKMNPHFMVMAMPTNLRICCGQRGHIEWQITLRGQPIPAALTDNSFNAIYEISDIIAKIRSFNSQLDSDAVLGKASLTVTHMHTADNGAQTLPELCTITLDRRFLPHETVKKMTAQLKELCTGTRANIEIVKHELTSYKNLRLPMEKNFPHWQIDADNPLVFAAETAFKMLFRKKVETVSSMVSSGGGFTMGLHKIPTIGFGPGKENNVGPINDHVRTDELEKAIAFYAALPGRLPLVKKSNSSRRRR